jgi:hypothetical protein
MRLSFLEEFVQPIQCGKKIQTTRLNLNKKIRKNSEVIAVAKKSEFGKLRIDEIELRTLATFDSEDAKREGFSSFDEFKEVWKKLYKSFDLNQTVYVIRFTYRPRRLL